MAKPPRPRTARRAEERATQRRVRDDLRDRERLFALSPGGTRERPIEVPSTAVIELRVGSLPCPLCAGAYRLDDHVAPAAGLRRCDVTCRQCGAPRALWFRVVLDEPN